MNLTLSGGGNCSWLASNGVMRGMVSNPSSETAFPPFFSLKLFPSLTIFAPAKQEKKIKLEVNKRQPPLGQQTCTQITHVDAQQLRDHNESIAFQFNFLFLPFSIFRRTVVRFDSARAAMQMKNRADARRPAGRARGGKPVKPQSERALAST